MSCYMRLNDIFNWLIIIWHSWCEITHTEGSHGDMVSECFSWHVSTCTRTHACCLFIHEKRAGQQAYFANGGAKVDVRAAAAVWSRPDWPTCAWLYPEPLCTQETTILTLAASEEPPSTEGGTENWQGRKTAKRGEKKGKSTTETKEGRRLIKDEKRTVRAPGQWRQTMDISQQASGNSFC